jgi:spermidine synthase
VTVLFSLTLFLSSALLFIVEPMVAKMALPSLGGTPAVWTVCMVFYQGLLLAGYAYAHELAKRLRPRRTALLHLALASLTLLVLPIHLPRVIGPATSDAPVASLLTLLAAGVGLPFLVLATYSSTLQTWYASATHGPGKEPYVLYSASNLGSLLGLFSYPVIIERYFGLAAQSRLWHWGYLGLVVLTFFCALTLWVVPEVKPAAESPANARVAVTRRQEVKWLVLAFIPSSLMLGVTTALTTELPPVPLLWILPLALYLLTFVLVFASAPITYHDRMIRMLPVLLVVTAFLIASKTVSHPVFSIPFHLALLFVACMACHGELALTRPPATGLTRFYLCIAIGGSLGGVFNGIVAPLIFKSVVELPLVLFLLAAAVAYMGARKRWHALTGWDVLLPLGLAAVIVGVSLWLSSSPLKDNRAAVFLAFTGPVMVCLSFAERPLRFALGFGAVVLASVPYSGPYGRVLAAERSFFGVYHVSDDRGYRELIHGSTIHGIQSLDPERIHEPLSYFSRGGPIGDVFGTPDIAGRLREIAVIGLGAGSLACYASSDRRFTFYEIDPLVERIARNPDYFSFLKDCAPESRVVVGDARLSLAGAAAHRYDLVVADAFSSDTVPVHLVTKEAVALYLSKLSQHGLLAFNISNRYLDLRTVLAAIAQDAGLHSIVRDDRDVDDAERNRGRFPSTWLLMARTHADFGTLAADPRWHEVEIHSGSRIWTDDFSALADTIRWR